MIIDGFAFEGVKEESEQREEVSCQSKWYLAWSGPVRCCYRLPAENTGRRFSFHEFHRHRRVYIHCHSGLWDAIPSGLVTETCLASASRETTRFCGRRSTHGQLGCQ